VQDAKLLVDEVQSIDNKNQKLASENERLNDELRKTKDEIELSFRTSQFAFPRIKFPGGSSILCRA